MAVPPRLYLITPPIADADAFAPLLREACGAGDIAAVLLRFAAADERTAINGIKQLAPLAQEAGAAVLVMSEPSLDAVTLATRGGADGIHVSGDPGALRSLRTRVGERILGAGGLGSRDDAMAAGEARVDYVMFGEPRRDGSVPALDGVLERSSWWSEIFETPCVAYAPGLGEVAPLAATGVEFVALGDAIWTSPAGIKAALATALDALSEPRP